MDQCKVPSIFDNPEIAELKGIMREIIGKMEEMNPKEVEKDKQFLAAEKKKAEEQYNQNKDFGKFSEDLAEYKPTTLVPKKKEKVQPVQTSTAATSTDPPAQPLVTEPEKLFGKRTHAEMRAEDKRLVQEGVLSESKLDDELNGGPTKRPCNNKEN